MATLQQKLPENLLKLLCSNTTVQQGSVFYMAKLSVFPLCLRAENIPTVLQSCSTQSYER